MKLLFKKLKDTAIVPVRATEYSAGYDLCSASESPIVIPIGEIRMIPIGIAVAPERTDVALFVFPRSGLASKCGVTLANSVGVIDSDYRGEIMVPLINHGKEDFIVTTGMRIAQLVVMPILSQEWTETDLLDDTSRGNNGFGSSGII